MTVLVVGATGATGRRLVRQLLDRGERVRAVVRSRSSLPPELAEHERLELTEASLLDLADAELADLVRGCGAVASCLGHTVSARGIFGPPRRLVTDATRRLCDAIRAVEPATPTRFVLMSSAGVANRDLDEPVPRAHAVVVALLRRLVPPHADNEQAAEHLRVAIGSSDPAVEWVAVRPDALREGDAVTPYTLHPSPTRSAIVDPGHTLRINVAHFMTELATDDAAFAEWRGRMPVIYDVDD